MIGHISRILQAFRPCFTRKAAYHWFVTVVLGGWSKKNLLHPAFCRAP